MASTSARVDPTLLSTSSARRRAVHGQQATLALGSRRVWPAKALASGYVFKRTRLEESLANAFHSPSAGG